MKITESHLWNTGGNIMVFELVIEDGGELKSIGIDGESYVGYDCRFEEVEGLPNQLWVEYGTVELERHVPKAIAVKCYDLRMEIRKMYKTEGDE